MAYGRKTWGRYRRRWASRRRPRRSNARGKLLSQKNLMILSAVAVGLMVWLNWDGIKQRLRNSNLLPVGTGDYSNA